MKWEEIEKGLSDHVHARELNPSNASRQAKSIVLSSSLGGKKVFMVSYRYAAASALIILLFNAGMYLWLIRGKNHLIGDLQNSLSQVRTESMNKLPVIKKETVLQLVRDTVYISRNKVVMRTDTIIKVVTLEAPKSMLVQTSDVKIDSLPEKEPENKPLEDDFLANTATDHQFPETGNKKIRIRFGGLFKDQRNSSENYELSLYAR